MRQALRVLRIVALLIFSIASPCTGSGSGASLAGRGVTPATAKPESVPPPPVQGTRAQGDTIADPFIVSAVPFTASGSTCGFSNDYEYGCPFVGSTSPEVVFAWEADADGLLDVDLCGSAYDTKVYVCKNGIGDILDCDNNYCGLQSYLVNIPLTAGNTYYIIVDGDDDECGEYELSVAIRPACVIECPPGAMPEGEPDCYDGYDDNYNGGCNVTPVPIFQEIEASCDAIVICGTTGMYDHGASYPYRDMDWFELDVTEPSQICVAGDSEDGCLVIIDTTDSCSDMAFLEYGVLGPCLPATDICVFRASPLWVIVVPFGPEYPCGSAYWIEITGYTNGVSPAASTTWGRVKGLFR